MKNFVITAVSAAALLGAAAANAQEKTAEAQNTPAPAVATPAEKAAPKAECPVKRKKAMKHRSKQARAARALAVYVNYPPVDLCAFNACPCEYYQGNQGYGYIYHGGYYWYPHVHGQALAGYTPPYLHGSYWYPSRLHPHVMYIDGKGAIAHDLYPVEMGAGKKALVKKKAMKAKKRRAVKAKAAK